MQSSRRPSRRAAVEAARRISHTVHNYNLNQEIKQEVDSPDEAAPPPRPYYQLLTEDPSQELDLVCEDEELSPSQMALQIQTRDNFNQAMKSFRELQALNVRVIQQGELVNFYVNVDIAGNPVALDKGSYASKPPSDAVFMTRDSTFLSSRLV